MANNPIFFVARHFVEQRESARVAREECNKSSPLLRLPRELRDIIYNMCIHRRHHVPRCDITAPANLRIELTFSPVTGLLQTCRLLRKEVLSVLCAQRRFFVKLHKRVWDTKAAACIAAIPPEVFADSRQVKLQLKLRPIIASPQWPKQAMRISIELSENNVALSLTTDGKSIWSFYTGDFLEVIGRLQISVDRIRVLNAQGSSEGRTKRNVVEIVELLEKIADGSRYRTSARLGGCRVLVGR